MNYIISNNTFNYKNVLSFIKKNFYQFNYINNFKKPLGNKKFNNDIGWSCTIKSFQMLLAKIIKIFYNKDKIVKLLYKEDGLLSIHNFIKHLNLKEFEEGVYLGSYLISSIYQEIINNNKLLFNLQVTQDNIIDINKLDFNKNTVLLFSTKLGLHNLNKDYKSLIYNSFHCKQFLGFIGGVGKSCYYFFGIETQSENLLYLDPHTVTEYNNNINNNKDLLTNNYSVVHIDHLNPSITFCFYYQDYQTFMELKKFLETKTIFNILNKIDFHQYYKIKKFVKKDDWEII